ncbi:MAG: hypothetical protein BWK76_22000 [Desulfobulbaceae bacterium A2]|nr:MAG: hypothetical protein BWK76_22000 [Desulfobulbaceae bacterium A2]
MRRILLVLLSAIMPLLTSVSLATENDVVYDHNVRETIALICNEYFLDVDVPSLEMRCIEAVQTSQPAQSPVDSCIARMIESLDGSYFDSEVKSEKNKDGKEHPPLVSARLFNAEIGYIRIRQFPEKTKELIKKEIAGMLATPQPLIGLIIDLRDNPGGSLGDSIQAAELFLPPDAVVSELKSRKKSSQRTFKVPSNKCSENKETEDILKTTPLAVLVNAGTSGGAELVAAALRDNHRAKVVGTATAQKGAIKAFFFLKNKRAILLPIGYLVAPNGQPIAEHGVTIDTEVTSNNPPPIISHELEEDIVVVTAFFELKSQVITSIED